jgi:hypothetical protein
MRLEWHSAIPDEEKALANDQHYAVHIREKSPEAKIISHGF